MNIEKTLNGIINFGDNMIKILDAAMKLMSEEGQGDPEHIRVLQAKMDAEELTYRMTLVDMDTDKTYQVNLKFEGDKNETIEIDNTVTADYQKEQPKDIAQS